MKKRLSVVKGTRDHLPAAAIQREKMLDSLRTVFRRYGFDPLETPALENWETLSGKYGEDAERLIYRFTDRGGRDIGLRYDLTVPLARVVASNPQLPKPFKRYQIQPVWRADKPQRGRFREFLQCDWDIVGSSSPAADAETIAVLHDCLDALDIGPFVVRISERGVIQAMLEAAGVPPTARNVLEVARAVDKLDKIGAEGVREELTKRGVERAAADHILTILERRSLRLEEGFGDAKGLFRDAPSADAAFERLGTLGDRLRDLALPEERLVFDLSLARGLDYYTGPVFEAVMTDAGVGSVAGGGRYDGLIGTFSGSATPAVGASIGLDRISAALQEREADDAPSTHVQVLVTVVDAALLGEAARLAARLRGRGLNTELYLGAADLRGQLGYARQKGVRFVAFLGPDEIAKGHVQIKDMKTRKQEGGEEERQVAMIRALLEEQT